MLKKIKKFFKWIADHTGISWISRKISSGWKWLFGGKANATPQNTSEQTRSPDGEEQTVHDPSKTTSPKTLDDQVNRNQPTTSAAQDEPQEPVVNQPKMNVETTGNPPTPDLKNADNTTQENTSGENKKSQEPVVNESKTVGEIKDCGSYLSLSAKHLRCEEYIDWSTPNTSNLSTSLFMYVKCGKNEYRITGTGYGDFLNDITIKSILKKNKDGKYVNGNIVLVEGDIKCVKEMLGLSDGVEVKVDSISKEPFRATTLEQSDTNTTGDSTTQQTVNNGSNETEVKQASSSTAADQAAEQSTSGDGILPRDSSEVASSSPAATDSILSKTLSTKNKQTKDNSRSGSTVALHQTLCNGKELHFSPELSNFLLRASRASLEREILFCKVVPSSLLVQTREELVADNDLSQSL